MRISSTVRRFGAISFGVLAEMAFPLHIHIRSPTLADFAALAMALFADFA